VFRHALDLLSDRLGKERLLSVPDPNQWLSGGRLASMGSKAHPPFERFNLGFFLVVVLVAGVATIAALDNFEGMDKALPFGIKLFAYIPEVATE
jgi:hypothetical protein